MAHVPTASEPSLVARLDPFEKRVQLPIADGETDAPELTWGDVLDPNGSIRGTLGDVYFSQTGSGATCSNLWGKKTGVESRTGWVRFLTLG